MTVSTSCAAPRSIAQHPPNVKATKYQEHSLASAAATLLCAIIAIIMPAAADGAWQGWWKHDVQGMTRRAYTAVGC